MEIPFKRFVPKRPHLKKNHDRGQAGSEANRSLISIASFLGKDQVVQSRKVFLLVACLFHFWRTEDAQWENGDRGFLHS